MDGHQVLSFQEFDTGRIIPYDRVINVPAFASKRLRVVFRANELGVLKITLRLENMNNSTNNSTITCRINVIDVTDNDSLVLELESGQIVGTGQTLELGDCYCGMTFRRRLWVKNISKDTVILDISSDNPSDIRLDFSGHIPDTNPESIKLNLPEYDQHCIVYQQIKKYGFKTEELLKREDDNVLCRFIQRKFHERTRVNEWEFNQVTGLYKRKGIR
jgi:hypothetical protein